MSEALNQLLLGILLGALGQGLRVVVGLKKAQDTAISGGQSFSQSAFDGTRLGISLFIGAMVGALTEMIVSGFKPLAVVDQNLVLKLVAAGYAGTDAIEGLLQRYLPSAGGAASPATGGTASGVTAATPQPKLMSLASVARSTALTAAAPSSQKPATTKVDPDVSLQIQLDVSLAVFPDCGTPQPGGGVNVNPQFSIADACAANPDSIALEVNAYASELATMNRVTWSNVKAPDISPLKVIKDLMTLVDKNLS